MNDEQFNQIIAELRGIREALQPKPKPASFALRRFETIPQPSAPVDNPQDVVVHFGKNQGRRLGELNEASLTWYAQEPQPAYNKFGKLYTPRPVDVHLRNAARTLLKQLRTQ